jgi:carbon-monoxide dehydrogenase large subunit
MGKVVGQNEPRVDGWEKVSGHAKFAADLHLGRLFHARVLRATEAHAYIRSLDTERARTAPGVRAVVSSADYPRQIGHAIRDHHPLAYEKVRYWGEPVAVVIADTVEAAEAALPLIRVEYEPLPPILHPRQALHPEAPLIHENLGEYPHDPQIHPQPGSNIAHHYWLRRGEAEAVFAHAPLVVEREYWVPWIAHVQLEPHCAWALWEGDSLTVWTSSQAPFFVRQTLAYMFDISPAKVRVVVPYVGGGFGGKSDVTIEPLLAIAARAVPGVVVQLLLTREEMFYGSVVGRGAWGRIKMAVDTQGMLLAEEAELYFGCGGYADYAVWISQGGGHNATGPYYIPHLKIDSYCVYTNTPPTGAYRGYGHPEVHWMVERHMDQIARRLGMDPLELRLKNLLVPGKVNAIGQMMQRYNGQPDRCLKAVAETLGAKSPPSTPRRVRGQGVACFMKSPVMRTNAQSGAIIRFNDDGSVTLYTGAVEIGQGSNTVLSQIAAEALSIPMEKVHYVPQIDTDFSPHEWQTVASHTTWAVGNAVRMAALDALQQIKQAASEALCVPIEDLEVKDGKVYPRLFPEQALPYSALATGYCRPDGSGVNAPIIGRGSFIPQGLTYPNPVTGQGNLAASWTFGCQGAEIEVDLDSGQIHVLRLITALDAGRIINPDAARGQVEGAMVQALGATLFEKLHFDPKGRMLNSSLVDYRIPLSVDVPELEVIFIETEDASGPYGARGLGEHGIVAIPAAIANALSDALGLEVFEIPISAEAVIEAIEHRREGR